MTDATTLPDQPARDAILHDLHTTMLVEAAAGTGKTTSMVGRMVNLLESGCCTTETMAAVTFTRKAAAEMRGRFQVELEKRAQQTEPGPARRNLRSALEHVERCFIGTIHSFCGSLLRERPVEAGVPVGFQPLEPDEDVHMRREAWEDFCARLHADQAPELQQLDELGVSPADLADAFKTFANYPDVDRWPCEPAQPLPDLQQTEQAFRRFAAAAMSIDPGDNVSSNDTVAPRCRQMWFFNRIANFETHGRAAELLGVFDRKIDVKYTTWRGENRDEKRALADGAKALFEEFREDVVLPFMQTLYEHRYKLMMQLMHRARELYDERRRAAGALNYQDLLLSAARLLREGGPAVRRHFAGRVTHLLVDEFQDTDPIQAEVMMLLTADDPEETRWRRCRPRPGSLFVVGDPKQSIYRFRRADIGTYNEVRRIIREHGGRVVTLSANFRSVEPLLGWVNQAFRDEFPDQADEFSPAYVGLEAGKPACPAPADGPIRRIDIPPEHTNQESIAEWEADFIARTIRRRLDQGCPVQTPKDDAPRPCRPGDFMIITRVKARMSIYARALQRLGIPHQVTGGQALNDVPELELLMRCVQAIAHPQDPVQLLAALRSGLFGVDDPALYALKRAGGTFDFRRNVPDAVPEPARERLREAMGRLRRYSRLLALLPPAVAVRRIAADLGLVARAAASEGGNVQAGSLARALELLHGAASERWSAAQVADFLRELAQAENAQDGLPARQHPEPPVRVMNLHKVKGLQAPVTFLADPSGSGSHDPHLHVSRSEDGVEGYLCAQVQRGQYNYDTVAQPSGWQALADHEKQFENAEATRLLYVAATRAGAELAVSLRARRKSKNPWGPLEAYLEGCPPLPDPGPQNAPSAQATELAPEAPAGAAADAARRAEAVATPTYRVEAAKTAAMGDAPAPVAGTADGTGWGAVIHTVLEARMRDPQADLERLARDALREEDIDEERAADAVQLAQSVAQSRIWQRARKAKLCLPEAPFTIAATDATEPTLRRGIVDLAFREPDGWVIVDYKTDQAAAFRLDALAAHYAPQVRAYAEAWRQMTGEPVKEACLYFSAAGRCVCV